MRIDIAIWTELEDLIMNGLDDLLILLEHLMTGEPTMPDGVAEALERLRKRRDRHEPFDLQILPEQRQT